MSIIRGVCFYMLQNLNKNPVILVTFVHSGRFQLVSWSVFSCYRYETVSVNLRQEYQKQCPDQHYQYVGTGFWICVRDIYYRLGKK